MTIVKSGLNYFLYVNNEEVGRVITSQNIPFARSARVAFANSPCLASSDERFKGRLDEIKIYTRALSERELVQNFLSRSVDIRRYYHISGRCCITQLWKIMCQ